MILVWEKRLRLSTKAFEKRVQKTPGIMEFEIGQQPGMWTVALYSIAVDRPRRGAGIGSKVIRTLTAWADLMGVEIVLCLTNSKLRRFYSKFGFTDCSNLLWDMHRMPGAEDKVING